MKLNKYGSVFSRYSQLVATNRLYSGHIFSAAHFTDGHISKFENINRIGFVKCSTNIKACINSSFIKTKTKAPLP